MPRIRSYITCNAGSSMVLTGLAFLLLIMTLGVVIDLGRLYAVQGKSQSASDAALLGAVSTLSTADLLTEYKRLLAANYPIHYMGGTLDADGITVQDVGGGVYEARVPINVPTVILSLFNIGATDLNIFSQVTRGLPNTARRLELSMVLDNTGSMSGAKIAGLRTASHDLVDILFGSADTLNNLHISIVPYDIVVNIGPDHPDWIQNASYGKYKIMSDGAPDGVRRGFAFNRLTDYLCGPYHDGDRTVYQHCYPEGDRELCNAETGQCETVHYPAGCTLPEGTDSITVPNIIEDCTSNGLEDVSDAPPTTERNKFRLPYERRDDQVYDGFQFFLLDDFAAHYHFTEAETHRYYTSLAPISFGENTRANVHNAVDAMTISGGTRIPIGLMWGWFTLSPNWQGLWDPSKPGLPAPINDNLDKAIVLMTDGKNIWGAPDDTKTLAMCNAIKASGITIYTVGFGTADEVNPALLQACASRPSYYWLAPTPEQLRIAFHAIADDLLYNSIRLSQ